mmetsp:Transcript_31994/g.110594  ORF Transcript_31994/g.110594 Transcript_31994/m.110594 type:complete len:136 (+) Transcript_31994:149-556(+)
MINRKRIAVAKCEVDIRIYPVPDFDAVDTHSAPPLVGPTLDEADRIVRGIVGQNLQDTTTVILRGVSVRLQKQDLDGLGGGLLQDGVAHICPPAVYAAGEDGGGEGRDQASDCQHLGVARRRGLADHPAPHAGAL